MIKPTLNPVVRKYLFISSLVLSLCFIVYLLVTYTMVTVSTQTVSSADITLKLTSLTTKKVKEYRVAAGEQKRIFIRHGNYNVAAAQGNNQTISSFTPQRLKSNQLDVALMNETKVSRIATGSLGCGKLFAGTYYSYRCGGEIRVFKHTPFQNGGRSFTSQLETSSTYRSLVPLANGAVGIVDIQDGGIDVEYMELPSGKISTIRSDFAKKSSNTSSYTVIANNTTAYQFEFAVVDQASGVWMLYRNPGDTQPLRIETEVGVEAIQKYNMVNESSQLKGSNIISLYEVETDADEGTANKEQRNKKTPNRNLVTITNILSKSTTSYMLPDNRKYDSVHLTDATHLAGETITGEVVVYDISGNAAKKIAEYQDVSGLSNFDSTTLIGVNRGIYKMSSDGSTLFRLFESDRLNLSEIRQDKEGVEVTSFVNERGPQYTLPDVYRLSLNEKAVYPQDQDTLPYIDSVVRSMDYNDSQIFIQLALKSFSTNRATGKVEYDPAEFQELANRVRAELSNKNLIRGRQLIFTY